MKTLGKYSIGMGDRYGRQGDIPEDLPSKAVVSEWSSKKFAESLRHDRENSNYNPNMRQLIHVAYKLAAQRMDEYLELLEINKDTVAQCVFDNMYNKHICRVFDIR